MTALLLALALSAVDADSLATARDLYASAAYEDALAVLNRLPPSNQSVDQLRTVERYRALCLLALGRVAEAERSIEAVIAGDPSYRPAADVSPRVRAAWSEVRRRMLPVIIQQQYTQAKAAFDRKEFAAASAAFTQTLQMLTDPDVEAAARQPPLSDLRTLASGFRDLAITAATPPPPPPPPAAPAPEPSPAAPPEPIAPVEPRVYEMGDENVVPPIALRQDLPPFPGTLTMARHGVIAVVIDEGGAVESARMTQSVSRQYDGLAVAAAAQWRYRPARLNGVAVKYLKTVQISVKPQPRRDDDPD